MGLPDWGWDWVVGGGDRVVVGSGVVEMGVRELDWDERSDEEKDALFGVVLDRFWLDDELGCDDGDDVGIVVAGLVEGLVVGGWVEVEAEVGVGV